MLFHRDVYWKENFDEQINDILDNNNWYTFSKHLRERHDIHDKKHNINYEKVNQIIHNAKHRHYKAFECETDGNGNVIKFVIRTTYIYNESHISIVFLKQNGRVLIKTVWLNKCKDKHFTLNENKYCKGCE